MKKIELTAEVRGVRLDKFLAEKLSELSRSTIQQLIREGFVLVEGALTKPGYKLKGGERISVTIPPPPPLEPEPFPIPLDVVYEDQWLIVINKPANLVVHPAPGHQADTLVNAVLAHWPELRGLGDKTRLGIVHRLDKDTSGLIVVAKDEKTKVELQKQFKERGVRKVYLALVKGELKPARGRIEAPIGRDPRHRKKMAVVAGGREAVTDYKVLEYLPGYTYVEVYPLTGRTHQIRVHFSHKGHPIAGDKVYGRGPHIPGLMRPFLHAYSLTFKHPVSGEEVTFKAPLPPELERILEGLRQGRL
jgi:23S rRNA pseudouridine1911/1915/1917 synthase